MIRAIFNKNYRKCSSEPLFPFLNRWMQNGKIKEIEDFSKNDYEGTGYGIMMNKERYEIKYKHTECRYS